MNACTAVISHCYCDPPPILHHRHHPDWEEAGGAFDGPELLVLGQAPSEGGASQAQQFVELVPWCWQWHAG